MIDMIASVHGDVIRPGAYVRCGAAEVKFVTQESKKERRLPWPVSPTRGYSPTLPRQQDDRLAALQGVIAITGYYATRPFIFLHLASRRNGWRKRSERA